MELKSFVDFFVAVIMVFVASTRHKVQGTTVTALMNGMRKWNNVDIYSIGSLGCEWNSQCLRTLARSHRSVFFFCNHWSIAIRAPISYSIYILNIERNLFYSYRSLARFVFANKIKCKWTVHVREKRPQWNQCQSRVFVWVKSRMQCTNPVDIMVHA